MPGASRRSSTGPTARRVIPPLDGAALDRLALRYVERFATTRGRLADYLRRKIRERGWEGPLGDPDALAERLAGLGYIDDRAFAEARAGAMTRRGLGARRVADALRHARVEAEDAEAVAPEVERNAPEAALAFARRKRIGPYARAVPDRDLFAKQLAAMARAGHGYELARRVLTLPLGEEVDPDSLR